MGRTIGVIKGKIVDTADNKPVKGYGKKDSGQAEKAKTLAQMNKAELVEEAAKYGVTFADFEGTGKKVMIDQIEAAKEAADAAAQAGETTDGSE